MAMEVLDKMSAPLQSGARKNTRSSKGMKLIGHKEGAVARAAPQNVPAIRELAALVSEKILISNTHADPECKPHAVAHAHHAPVSAHLEFLIHEHHHDPGGTACQAHSALVLEGRLNVAALEAALSDLVGRHEALRTSYGVDASGNAVPTIHPPWTATLPVDTAESGQTGAVTGGTPASWAQGLPPPRFDPSKLPLICWRLLKISDSEHVLLQAEHRFLHDRWSSSLIKRELAIFYNLRIAGGRGPAIGEPAQFREFWAHERHWLHTHECRKSINFWREYLRGACALLELRGAVRRSAQKSFVGKQRRLSLPYPVWAAIVSAAERAHVSACGLMFSMFGELVGELSGKTDFLIGMEVANRSRREFHDTVGMIANLLPVRLVRDETDSLRARMDKHARSLQRALSHEAVPLPAIVAVADLRDRLVGIPPVQVCFGMHAPAAREALRFEGLKAAAVEAIPNGGVMHDLGVAVFPPAAGEAGGDLVLVFGYNTSIYYGAIVDTVAREYARQLEALAGPAGR